MSAREEDSSDDASHRAKRSGLGRGLASLIPTGPDDGATSASMGHRMGDAAADVLYCGGAAGSRRAVATSVPCTARSIPSAIEPNPRQPRQVFDEEALAELVHSIREFGLMQPIVVRAHRPGRRPAALSARHGGAALARRPGGRPGDHPGDRAGDRRRQHAARRPAGEHPPGPAEPVGRGGGLPTAARRVRGHPRRTRGADRAVASGDHAT